MSLTLKPYPNYKAAGLPWLDRIPSHWSVRPAKRVFTAIDVRSETGDEELLTVSSRDGVVPRSQKNVTMFKAESYVGHKLCWPGDLVINSLWAWAGGLGFAWQHGIISSAYGVYRPKPCFSDATDYLNYALRSPAYDWELHVRSKGIWVSRLQLTDESFFGMPVVIPPNDEALSIARFLKTADNVVRKLIRAKRRVIVLLSEQKGAIVDHAVTHGLDPDARHRRSTVAWLDAVPPHWDEIRLKFLVSKITDGEHISPTLAPSGVPLLSAKDVRDGSILYNVDKFVTQENAAQFWRRCRPERGDLLIVSRGATIGRVAIVAGDTPFCLMGSVILCKKREEYSPEFLYYALNAHHAQRSLWFASASSAQQALYIRDIAELRLPTPPLHERKELVRHLDKELFQLNHSLEQIQREIDLIRQYRTRLIADVITGKLDVRGVQLPEIETPEELDALTETDEEGVDGDAELVGAEEAEDVSD